MTQSLITDVNSNMESDSSEPEPKEISKFVQWPVYIGEAGGNEHHED